MEDTGMCRKWCLTFDSEFSQLPFYVHPVPSLLPGLLRPSKHFTYSELKLKLSQNASLFK
jgi:hypothetical protein